jgi:hypothetical protein
VRPEVSPLALTLQDPSGDAEPRTPVLAEEESKPTEEDEDDIFQFQEEAELRRGACRVPGTEAGT